MPQQPDTPLPSIVRCFLRDVNPQVGPNVESTANPFEGAQLYLQSFEEANPDVLVLDISMEALSRLDVAQRLAQTGHQARIVFHAVPEEPEFLCALSAWGRQGMLSSRASIPTWSLPSTPH